MGRPNPYRHPLGRTCRDPKNLLFAAVLTLFYALPRYAFDCMRGRP
jgi:hypothetical protein